MLVAGDLSALPAIAAIASSVQPDDDVRFVLEVPDLADAEAFGRTDLDVHWVTADHDRPGAALVSAVQDGPPMRAPTYCWFAADQATAAILRRHALRDRGLAPDRVMFMGYGSFASHSYISEKLCAKMPDELGFEDGATMPCVYSTSIWSLFHVGNLKKGQVSVSPHISESHRR